MRCGNFDVGYQTKDIVKGFSCESPTFVNVGKTTISITDLIPRNADGEAVGGAVFNLQTKKPSGGADEQFLYLLEDDVGEELGDGWYNNDGETLATKAFAPGEGFVFYSGVEGGTLLFSGEVYQDAVDVTLPKGFSALGNFRPTEVSLSSLIPVNAEGETVGSAVFNLQTKKPSGGADEQFLYLLEDDVGEELGDGWYNNDGETLATKKFAAGEGFVFYSGVEGGTLKFPAL